MTPEQEQTLKADLEAIAQILYDESDPEAMTTLEGIEVTLRQQIQAHVSPELGNLLSERSQERRQAGRQRKLKSSLGDLVITTQQAQKLAVATQPSSKSPSGALLLTLKCQRVLPTSRAGCGLLDGHPDCS